MISVTETKNKNWHFFVEN